MTNKRALQIVIAEAVKSCSGQEPVISHANSRESGIVYTTAELKQAIYRVNKHIKHEVN